MEKRACLVRKERLPVAKDIRNGPLGDFWRPTVSVLGRPPGHSGQTVLGGSK